MITRPLDLASRLRPVPRNFDTFFYANIVLLGVFFSVFGSRFMLSPGIELGGAILHEPVAEGAMAGAVRTSAVISVLRAGLVFTEDGPKSYGELAAWLPRRVAELNEAAPWLLVRADAAVPLQDLFRIHSMAIAAGFAGVQLAAEPVAARASGRP